MQSGIKHIVCNVQYDTAQVQRRKECDLVNRPVCEARKVLVHSSPSEKRPAVQALRRVKRQARVSKHQAHLRKVCLSASSRSRPMPQTLVVNGERTADRSKWLAEARRFCRARFGEPGNAFSDQNLRLEKLASRALELRLDGIAPPKLSPFSCVSGRAKKLYGCRFGWRAPRGMQRAPVRHGSNFMGKVSGQIR